MKDIQLLFTHAPAADLGWALLHFVWQGGLIAGLFALLRRAGAGSARVRYALACLTLGAMACAPILTYGFLAAAGRWQPAGGQVSGTAFRAAVPEGIAAGVPWYLVWSSNLQAALPWLVLAWFAGALLFLIRLAAGSVAAARLRTNANRPAPPALRKALERMAGLVGVSREVGLLVSALVEVPVVVGWLRPVVLLPASALTGLAPEYLEALLAHELAHIRRNDYLVNVLQSVVEAVLFYHPAVWWVSNEIRKEREHCCDDLAVAASGSALTYVHALADLELCRPIHARAAMASNGGTLVERIRRLADGGEPAGHTVKGPVAAFSAALIVLSAAGVMVLRGGQAATPQGSVVDRNTIWVDTVKRGDLVRAVRGLGKLTSSTTAELRIPGGMMQELRAGQSVSIRFPQRTEAASGKVERVNPGVPDGSVAVRMEGALPSGVPEGSAVDGTIEIEHLNDVLQVGRPVTSQSGEEDVLFKLEADGQHAVRVKVRYGRVSVNAIEVISGLQPGDKVILSDMAGFEGSERITLK